MSGAILGAFPRVRFDRNHPEAMAVCDRCGFIWNRVDLQWQMEWYGNDLQSTGFLVCEPCMDIPFELDRPIILPPDPEPVKDPRPPAWAAQVQGNDAPPSPFQPIDIE